MTDFRVVALAGGVGGAKLATGLQAILPHSALTVIVNSGDDFEHWGLTICPDIDTVIYNLAGINDPTMGWGRADDSFSALETMSQLGGEDWFRLGDRDLAIHLRRTEWLQQGISMSEVTDRLRRSLGVPSRILPMSDSPVRTLVHTDEGDMPFQHYFVRRQCEPLVIDVTFVGADRAQPSDDVLDALDMADLIVFCPSNPYLSIDPILSVSGLRRYIRKTTTPCVGVTPIVGGAAIKGPAAKMMRELGHMISPLTVVDHYDGLLNGFVLDQADEVLHGAIDVPVLVTDTIMHDLDSKARLAQAVLDFAAALESHGEVSPPDTTLSTLP